MTITTTPTRGRKAGWIRFLATVLSCLWIAASTVYAANGLTPQDVARIRGVTSAVISPDGSRIAYTLGVPRDLKDQDNGASWTELHMIESDGSSHPYVTGKVNVGGVRWTPDGTGLSFLSKRGDDENRALYVIPLTGGEARKIVQHDADISSYSWSPDGKRVAFLATEAEPKSKKDAKKKGFNQEIYEEEKPFVRVWVHDMRTDDTAATMLALEGSASGLHFGPDGRRLALALAPTPLVDDGYMERRVRVVDAETGAILARIDNPGKLGEIEWSPDGAHIAFIAGTDAHDPSAGRLMLAPAGGGAMRDLLPNFEGNIRSFAWRDPQTITFIADQGVWSYIDQVGLDANEVRIFPAPQGLGSDRAAPIGAPEDGAVYSDISLSRDGSKAAFTGNSWRHPTEVYRRDPGDPAPRRLTESNPWLADVSFGVQEVVRYRARDGLDLEGILIRPLDEKPGQRYPLILTVHGGPESHYRNGWMTAYSSPGQVAATQGFAVFYPNYRGSTGRGVAFSKLSQGDPAGKEFDDFVDGVDHLVAQGLVEKSKVGITGGSYGGYASAWGATYYSDRFAASVMSFGIADKISKLGTTDIPKEEIAVHALHPIWENWQFALERSPIYYADRNRTPTLIFAGKDDPRVHPGQSMELYRHLKMRGKAPVRLVFYPGEGHGNSKAAARLDYNLRLMQWMEYYLKGPGGEPPAYELKYDE
ncbi:MAG: S9 family peptidase [Candidatus Zixiibacteriota bacterium]